MGDLHGRLCDLFGRDTVRDRAQTVARPDGQRALKVVVLYMEIQRGGHRGNYWFEVNLYEVPSFRVERGTELSHDNDLRLDSALRANQA